MSTESNKSIDEMIQNEIWRLSTLIDSGKYKKAYKGTLEFLRIIEIDERLEDEQRYLAIFHIAGQLIDIGGGIPPNKDATNTGLDLLKKEKENILSALESKGAYHFTLSNGLSNLTKDINYDTLNFTNIEELINLKASFWRTLKYLIEENGSDIPPQCKVNLGISLSRQFRVVEALQIFDEVIKENKDIPQAYTNRSISLRELDAISGNASLQLFEQIKKGFEVASKSKSIPPEWVKEYKAQANLYDKYLNKSYKYRGITKVEKENDLHQSRREYEEHSDYRKFCIQKYLTLSEHGLYCHCIGSARDELSIMGQGVRIVGGNEITAMEMVLNRIKSEFSLARRFNYEYIKSKESNELFYESCFTELFNNELLGIDIEKVRTAFRLCFGILDKIAVAVCELYDIYPTKKDKKVDFYNTLWRLKSNKSRREQFELIKNPGLFALYSIATDLNEKKDGEWAFFKEYRNNLEHSFIVIHESDNPSEMYNSHEFLDKKMLIKESDYIQHLEQLMQLTRSAIFSFVYMVRGKSFKEMEENGNEKILHRFFDKQEYPARKEYF